jgi:peptidoglycan/xylan/chitin deacetylase (PgdA/CDA1 family)
VVVTFDDGFQNVFDHAVPVLTKYQIPATCFVPTGFIGREAGWMADKRNDERCLLERLVTAQELAAVDSRWITIGSHSVNHPHLATLPQASLDRELVESKQTLERIVGRAVSTLSFPYGSFSEKVLDAAGAAGYTQVFANVPVCPAAELTPTLVGRIGVSAQDWPVEFKLKVQGGYEWLSVVIPAKRAVLRWVRWQSRP